MGSGDRPAGRKGVDVGREGENLATNTTLNLITACRCSGGEKGKVSGTGKRVRRGRGRVGTASLAYTVRAVRGLREQAKGELQGREGGGAPKLSAECPLQAGGLEDFEEQVGFPQ